MRPEPRGAVVRSGRTAWLLGAMVLAGVLAGALATSPRAQEYRFFTIGTGGTGGTYYPLAGVIANAISNPPGSRPCDQGGSCGVPGLIAVAQTSNGSVDNVRSVQDGLVDAAFSQSDIAYWAYTGTGIFEGEEPLSSLRAIAALYPEHVHLVASVESGIEEVADLVGKRVSVDTQQSGTYVDAMLILEAFGLSEDDIDVEHLRPNAAADAMRMGELDAFFVVAGYPTAAISEIARTVPVRLVPIPEPDTAEMIEEYEFFSVGTVPGGTYEGVDEDVETLAVGAQWITSEAQPEELIYRITKALWNDATRRLLDVGHPKGASVLIDTALDGIGIPLHPGAELYYREIGLIE